MTSTTRSSAVVDLAGKVLEGRRKPFSSRQWTSRRIARGPRSRWCCTRHPPHATAFLLARPLRLPWRCLRSPSRWAIRFPTVPRLMPKTPEAGEGGGAAAASKVDAMLLSGSGALTLGASLEQALLRMEVVEHYAKILSIARGPARFRRCHRPRGRRSCSRRAPRPAWARSRRGLLSRRQREGSADSDRSFPHHSACTPEPRSRSRSPSCRSCSRSGHRGFRNDAAAGTRRRNTRRLGRTGGQRQQQQHPPHGASSPLSHGSGSIACPCLRISEIQVRALETARVADGADALGPCTSLPTSTCTSRGARRASGSPSRGRR